ncbi:hypothetical protein EIP91_009346 [Steccherinum ochraceum]|uniref:G-protein coupled receptors family 1 profile domain-containing protein n=1 Tax=Steccherinum ochraceum TaxID=92696 RepID=A0A4R0RMT9_9APHY|nr:hypothetical protein EIP91_009346 [Steccherinum ochraceum]
MSKFRSVDIPQIAELVPMSSLSNSTSPGLAPGSIPLLPPGIIWLEEAVPAVNFLIISTTLGAVEVVMLCALLFFSTPRLRRSAVFFLTLLAILIGLVKAAVNCYPSIRSLEYPDQPTNQKITFLSGVLNGTGPIYLDCTLLVRLYAIYSARRASRTTLALLVGFPLVLSVGRIVNSTVFCVRLWADLQKVNNDVTASATAGEFSVTTGLPLIKTEWALQIFDDCYSSTLFLYPLYKSGALSQQRASFSKKIATLFWISATNFVFPVVLSVAQLVALLVIPSRYDIALYINEVNIHISIIAVVFATVWVFEGRWAETHGLVVTTVPAASQFSAMRFGVAGTHRDGVDERATKQTHVSEKAQDTMESPSSSGMHFAASSPDSMLGDAERGKGGNAFQVVVL